ncbi:PdcA protein [Escherichia coli]
MARKYNKLSREALKMLLDGVSRREVKQYLVGKQIGARTAIAVLCRQEMVVLKQRMLGSCHERCNSDPHPTPEIRSRG